MELCLSMVILDEVSQVARSRCQPSSLAVLGAVNIAGKSQLQNVGCTDTRLGSSEQHSSMVSSSEKQSTQNPLVLY